MADSKAVEAKKPDVAIHIRADLSKLAPTSCEGASRFNAMAAVCCLLFLGPLVVLLPLAARASASAASTFYIVTGCVSGVAFLWFCWGVRMVLLRGVCCKPARPAAVCALQHGAETMQRVAVRKVYIIVNPYGGTQKALRILENDVLPVFLENNIEADVLRTQYAGHAIEYARTVSFDGYQALCVIGGDGSFHEVVNGLLSREDGAQIPLGLIPGGSGNSVMHTLGCATPREAAQRIARGEHVAIDANLVQDQGSLRKYSINLASWGLIGDVAVTAESARCLGPSRYDICGVWFILKLAFKRAKMTIGSEPAMDGEFVTAAITASQHMGKGLRLAPAARMDDGLFDVSILRSATRGELLAQFLLIPEGRHYTTGNPSLQFKQVSQCSFDLAQPRGVLNIDGEIVPYEGTIRMTCVRHAFRMFAPIDCMPL